MTISLVSGEMNSQIHRGTQKDGIFYSHSDDYGLVGYSDSAWAGDADS